MITKTAAQFELLSLTDKETILSDYAIPVSRRESNGFVITLYLLQNRYYEAYFYMRSHEMVRAEMISEDIVYIEYQNLFNQSHKRVA
ncbi:MAG: hypothetical protein ABI855_01210 [Bacteroidota bacterium]